MVGAVSTAARVRLQDVAAEAGVSISAASLALTGNGRIPEATRERVRAAADTRFFAEDLGVDGEARDAVSDVTALARHLVESERWLDESARRLLQDLLACGPLQPVA